jgi:hypothetical protein
MLDHPEWLDRQLYGHFNFSPYNRHVRTIEKYITVCPSK